MSKLPPYPPAGFHFDVCGDCASPGNGHCPGCDGSAREGWDDEGKPIPCTVCWEENWQGSTGVCPTCGGSGSIIVADISED